MKDIFVGNLEYETSEDELRQLFAAYGPVDRVRIVTDRYSGQPRGFAFVEIPKTTSSGPNVTLLVGIVMMIAAAAHLLSAWLL